MRSMTRGTPPSSLNLALNCSTPSKFVEHWNGTKRLLWWTRGGRSARHSQEQHDSDAQHTTAHGPRHLRVNPSLRYTMGEDDRFHAPLRESVVAPKAAVQLASSLLEMANCRPGLRENDVIPILRTSRVEQRRFAVLAKRAPSASTTVLTWGTLIVYLVNCAISAELMFAGDSVVADLISGMPGGMPLMLSTPRRPVQASGRKREPTDPVRCPGRLGPGSRRWPLRQSR